jgi:hypothetical protein
MAGKRRKPDAAWAAPHDLLAEAYESDQVPPVPSRRSRCT